MFIHVKDKNRLIWISESWRKDRIDNQLHLDRLADCLNEGNCGPGERTVIVLASQRFGEHNMDVAE